MRIVFAASPENALQPSTSGTHRISRRSLRRLPSLSDRIARQWVFETHRLRAYHLQSGYILSS